MFGPKLTESSRVVRAAAAVVVEQLERRQLLAATLTATPVSTTAIQLAYTNPDGFHLQLERKNPDDVNFHLVADLGTSSGNPSYAISSLTKQTEYEFRLRYVDARGVAGYIEAKARTLRPVASPITGATMETPDDIIVTPDPFAYPSGVKVKFHLDDPAWDYLAGSIGLTLARVDDPYGIYPILDIYNYQGWTSEVPGGTDEYDTVAYDLAKGQSYSFQLHIWMSPTEYSGYSETISFTAPGLKKGPLKISAGAPVSGQIPISWEESEYDPQEGVTIFAVSGGSIVSGGGTFSVEDGMGWVPVQASGTQYFAVATDAWGGSSEYSNFVDGSGASLTTTPPAAPDNFTAKLANPDGQGAINLLWDNVPNNETNFDWVSYTWDEVPFDGDEVDEDVTSFSVEPPNEDLGWIFGMSYYFEVWSKNDAGSSASDFAEVSLPRICPICPGGISPDGQARAGMPTLNSNTSAHGGGQGVASNGASSRKGDPALVQIGANSFTVIFGPGDQIYFDWDAGKQAYVGDFGITDTFTAKGGNYVLTDSAGNQTVFSGTFNASRSGPISAMLERRDPSGNKVEVTRDVNGRITEVLVKNLSNVALESWTYAYVSGGVNDGLLQSIALREKDGLGAWVTVRSLSYTYYDGTTDDGLAGQIKTATLADASTNSLETYYYRYYAAEEEGGFAGALKYSLGTDSYQRLLEATSASNADSLTDGQLAPYADTYMEYDDSRRVALRTVQGDGCSSCTGGQGTYEYVYEQSAHADGVNNWHYKTTETLPDGNQNVTYFNYRGQVMLSVFVNTATNAKWGTFQVYDADGRVVMTAEPSAVSLPSSFTTIEAYADLLHEVTGSYQYLNDSAGLIRLTEYYSSTTATESSAGGVAGYWQHQKIKQGESGTAVLLSSVNYIAHDDDTDDADDTLGGGAGDDITIYPVANQTQYRETNGTGGQTTSYTYTWFTDSLQAESKTTTNPIVTTAQNGSNSATSSTNVYDTFGRVIWHKDEDGYIHYNEYHGVTGGLTRQITDVDTSIVSNEPSGWTTPAGGGLYLTTDYVVDELGRTTKMTDPNGNVTYTVYDDVNQETRVYRGWNATTGTTTGPIEVTRYDRARGYSERLTMSATPSTSGLSGSYVPTGGESIANVQSLSRDILNASGQAVERVVYTDLTATSYSQSTVKFGTAGVHYDLTEIGYDNRGRQARVKNANGTWTHTVYDGLGRVASTWVGTNNTGWTQTDPTGASTSGNNMVKVSENEYDNGDVGDGNLTESTAIPGAGAINRVSAYFYDWRNRLVAAKSGVEGSEGTDVQRQISYTDYDNLDQVIASYVYDGDNVTITSTSGVPNKPSSSLLRAKSTADYDELGRSYRSTTFSVDPSGGTVSGTGLVSNTWFDNRGQVIKASVPEQAVTKIRYDGAGRVTKQFAASSWDDKVYGDVDDVSGDIVHEQTEYLYDANGNVIQTTVRQRFHDAYTGELGNPSSGGLTAKARVSYTGSYYDNAGRLIESLNVGTNGGSNWTRPADSLIPSRADDVLRTSYSYDAAGRMQDVTDPKAIVARTEYDLAGRTTRTIEAYGNGVPTASSNRITAYTYDGLGNVTTIKAVLPDGPDVGSDYDVQETKYLYGATTGRGDGLNSNDVLIAVRYPDKSTGLASSGEEEVFITSALGQTLTKTDRNGSVHTFSYDLLGRVTGDAVTTLGSNVDDAILRIETTYNTQGLVEKITSYDDDVAGDVVNEIQREYNGFGQLTTEWQAHDEAVNTGSTPKVQYVYSEMMPTIDYENSDEALAGLASLPDSFMWNGVQFTRSLIDIASWTGEAGGVNYEWSLWCSSGETIPRFHFGAYSGENWRIVSGELTAGNWSVWGTDMTETDPVPTGFLDGSGAPTIPPYLSAVNHSRLVSVIHPNGRKIGYSYEGWGNNAISRLHSVNAKGRSYDQGREIYSYLGLDTVVVRDRVFFQGMSLTYIGTPGDAGDQYAGLDRFGRVVDQNWVSESSTTVDRYTYTYDRNSNRTTKTNELEGTLSETYTYDSLNRLTATTRNSTTHQSWSLDALGNSNSVTTGGVPESRTHNSQNQLTTKGSDSLTFDDNGNTTIDQNGLTLVYDAWNRLVEILNGVSSEIRYEYDGMARRIEEADADQYFNADWQVVEEQVSGETTISNVWSAVYVDALIVRDRNTVGDDSVLEEQVSFLQDPNYNVIALVDDGERIIERYIYDAYGKRTVLDDDWSADSDGISDVDNRQGHQGGFYDRVVDNQMLFRNRIYDVETMRWLQQDPIGYVDSISLYQAYNLAPVHQIDPTGKQTAARGKAAAAVVLPIAIGGAVITSELLKNHSSYKSALESGNIGDATHYINETKLSLQNAGFAQSDIALWAQKAMASVNIVQQTALIVEQCYQQANALLKKQINKLPDPCDVWDLLLKNTEADLEMREAQLRYTRRIMERFSQLKPNDPMSIMQRGALKAVEVAISDLKEGIKEIRRKMKQDGC